MLLGMVLFFLFCLVISGFGMIFWLVLLFNPVNNKGEVCTIFDTSLPLFEFAPLIFTVLSLLCVWQSFNCKCSKATQIVRIRFSLFKNLYQINDKCVINKCGECLYRPAWEYFDSGSWFSSSYYQFTLSFIDFIRFEIWWVAQKYKRKKKKISKEQKEQNEILVSILQEAQESINKLKAQSEQEINQAKDIAMEVHSRLRKNS